MFQLLYDSPQIVYILYTSIFKLGVYNVWYEHGLPQLKLPSSTLYQLLGLPLGGLSIRLMELAAWFTRKLLLTTILKEKL